MFSGLSALLADLVFVLGPLLIVSAEAPQLFGWLERRRLDPILNPAIAAASVGASCHAPVRISTAGLLDPEPTERIVPRDFAAPTQPVAAVSESAVLVGAGGVASQVRVRPSIRLPRS